jgi:hypothetical protein
MMKNRTDKDDKRYIIEIRIHIPYPAVNGQWERRADNRLRRESAQMDNRT